MNKMLRLPVALAFALGASNAFALGLGQVQVKSTLNQPLLAEIPVLENAPGEAADLQIRLASSEAFARIGLERPSAALLTSLNFEIVQGQGGKPVIRITTPNRVNDPFVSLLIEAEWARGKLLREYTLLLDPPVVVPSRVNPSQTQALPQGDVRPAPSESLAQPPPMATPRAAAPTAAPSFAPGESYGPVNSGDSLWKIASQSIPDSTVNINQMMMAIQRANPDAFIGGNINRLRTGAVLRIPSREEISAVSAREAAQFVREQTSADTPLQPIETDRRAARPAPAPTPSRPADSRLAIVPPRGDQPASAAQTGASSDGEGRELRADLARAREQSEVLDQENRELKSRVQELEKIRGDSERLLELRNSELQALQQRLAELEAQRAAAAATPAPAPVAAPPAPAVETPAPALEPLDPVVETPAPADTGAEVPDLDSADSAPTEESTVAEAPVAEPAATEPPVAAPTPAPAEAAATAPADAMPPRPPRQEWYQNPLLLGGGGALVIGLLALLGLRGRGKKKAAAAAAAPSRFEGTDFGVPASAGDADHDPAGYEDAEERELLDRVAEQPDDLERHIDLVRYYYGLNDAARFEGAVEAMYAQVYDPDDSHWQQALQMGREMLPDHPLFMELPAQDSAGGWEPAAEAGSQASAYDSAAYRAEASIPEPQVATPRFDDEPEFRIDLSEPELVVPEVEHPVELEPLSFEAPPAFASPDPVPAASAHGDDTGLNADAIEAAATKLELARAYLDMGDVEGARGMLEEVAQEGTAEQRQDARRLLDEIR